MSTISSFRIPGDLLFGAGALAQLPQKTMEYGGSTVFLVTDTGLRVSGWPDRAASLLQEAGIRVNVFDRISGEPDLDTLEACRSALIASGSDLVVGLGGGSAMDTAKAAACLAVNEGEAGRFFGTNLIPKRGLPVIAVPTTAGTASEITPNAIFADPAVKVKKGIVSPFLIPQAALVDPELTYSLPPAVTAASGMDALVHAVESYLSPKATLLTRIHAMKAMELIHGHLRLAVQAGKNKAAREAMAWGSLLAGLSFANAGVGGVHALAYPLGGEFHVSHGVSNALLLAPVMRFHAMARPDLFAEFAGAFGVRAAGRPAEEIASLVVTEMQKLCLDVGIPQRMRDLGVPKEAIEPMALAASQIDRLLANNPRPMTVDDIRQIYTEVW